MRAKHGPSGVEITTDAPVDNQGKGRSFSPTDLLATSLATCMATIMAIVAERHHLSLEGMRIRVEKHMVKEPVRRVGSLIVEFFVPTVIEAKQQKLLEHAAHTCPVHASLHPDIQIKINFNWGKN